MYDDFFSDGHNTAVVDVSAFFDSGVAGKIAELVGMGVLVSIGTTRDRGAISITVTSDGRWRRQYFRDSADASDWLGLAADAVSGRGVGHSGPDLPATQKPVRRRQGAARGPL